MKVTDKVRMETTKGNIVIGLYGEEAPKTVENFISHVKAGYYTKLLFHRVIPDFMIQAGGFMSGMFEKKELLPPIKLEISPNVKHDKYVISMARTDDPNSASSQFFICVSDDCHFLDGKYAAFGIVEEGQNVCDAIAEVQTKSVRHHDDVPAENVQILKAEMID